MEATTSPAELEKALQENWDTIIIEGSLAARVARIKTTGKIAWAVAFVTIALAVAIFATNTTTALTQSPNNLALALVIVGVISGYVGLINKLRKYRATERSEDRVILRKK
jgi:uncharacterized membrane protein YidH (DUF202 family)